MLWHRKGKAHEWAQSGWEYGELKALKNFDCYCKQKINTLGKKIKEKTEKAILSYSSEKCENENKGILC